MSEHTKNQEQRPCTCHIKKRSLWGPGPWAEDPDKVSWEHAGLSCVIHRSCCGAWCGYVAVLPSHLWHGEHHHDPDIFIHGGLTRSGNSNGCVCVISDKQDDVWWFGFDCTHEDEGDHFPGDIPGRDVHHTKGHYWTMKEVQEETNRLAEQLAAPGQQLSLSYVDVE